MLESLIEQLHQAKPLSPAQAEQSVQALIEESVPPETKADFLSALAQKGETAGEIATFARLLRDKATQPPLDEAVRAHDILDVCGTGGDKLNTFNISTTVAFVAAAAGITVAKHGNRAITSKSGSADVLEALGVPIDLPPEQAATLLKDQQFAFFFAPHYHPAFKHIAPARKLCAQRGQRTIFNFLGPLLNPARATVQLIGVPRPALCEPLAQVLQSIGLRRAMVVCGSVPTAGETAYLDELSTLGDTTLAEFYQERGFHTATINPAAFPVQPATLEDLRGGDRDANATIIRQLLSGHDTGPKRDAVLLNSAAALLVAGKAKNLDEGWQQAAELLDSGTAAAKLDAIIEAGRNLTA